MSRTDLQKMVEEQIVSRGVRDQRVLTAMRTIDRSLFVPSAFHSAAYADEPLPIGHGQTISQPYIVAYMTEAARLSSGDRVLEIGTGSGYQSAILAEIVQSVYTIEISEPLAMSAARRFSELGYKNIIVKRGDGYDGWPEETPFDAIIITAAPPEIPRTLLGQLAPGGRMVVPVGSLVQELCLITKTATGFEERYLMPVRFVPIIHPGKE